MIYTYTVSTAANVTSSSPTRTRLVIERGILHRLDVGFPPGPQGLLHAQVLRFGAHLFPTNPDGNFAWDDLMQSFPTWVEINTAPLDVELVTWNDDDTFAHSVTIQMLIDPLAVLRPEPQGLSILQRLDSFLGRGRRGGA